MEHWSCSCPRGKDGGYLIERTACILVEASVTVHVFLYFRSFIKLLLNFEMYQEYKKLSLYPLHSAGWVTRNYQPLPPQSHNACVLTVRHLIFQPWVGFASPRTPEFLSAFFRGRMEAACYPCIEERLSYRVNKRVEEGGSECSLCSSPGSFFIRTQYC